MNVTDEMIGDWQKRMSEQEDAMLESMTQEERMKYAEDEYINHLLEEHPELFEAYQKLAQQIQALEQENETLRSANEDLLKENHTLKNFKKVDIEHPSNNFF